jgi:hypothetical protein
MSKPKGAVAHADNGVRLRPPPSTAWQPGQSGNPSGRAKVPKDVVEQARKLAPHAMRKIAKIMKNPKSSPAVQLAAAVHIVDRACGKPASFSTGSPDAFRKAIDMTDDELAAIVLAGRGKVLELVPKDKSIESGPASEDADVLPPRCPDEAKTG